MTYIHTQHRAFDGRTWSSYHRPQKPNPLQKCVRLCPYLQPQTVPLGAKGNQLLVSYPINTLFNQYLILSTHLMNNIFPCQHTLSTPAFSPLPLSLSLVHHQALGSYLATPNEADRYDACALITALGNSLLY